MREKLKVILGILILLVIIIGSNEVLKYVLVEDAQDQVRYAMNEMYKQDNIETVFLGSSHVFCGYDPRVLDEILEENTYLAATPVQKIDGSYYVLKELLKKNDIKTVYLDMYYRQYRDEPSERTDDQMQYIYCITDYMKNSWNRIEFLLNACDKERYMEGFFAASRYGNHLLDLQRFERTLKSKRNDAYKNVERPVEVGDGFYKGAFLTPGNPGNPNMIDKIGYFDLAPIAEDNVMSGYSLKYLEKLVNLCKEEGIRLVLTATPMTDFHLIAMGNYTLFYDFVKDFADKNDIEYYDFNMCRKEVMNLADDCFMDVHHLSGKGAVEFSTVFAKVMKNYTEEEREELFYLTVEEKMQDINKRTFGIFLVEEDGYIVNVAANYSFEKEYCFVVWDSEGNEKVLQEYGENNVLKLIQGGTNKVKISVRDKESKKVLQERRRM